MATENLEQLRSVYFKLQGKGIPRESLQAYRSEIRKLEIEVQKEQDEKWKPVFDMLDSLGDKDGKAAAYRYLQRRDPAGYKRLTNYKLEDYF